MSRKVLIADSESWSIDLLSNDMRRRGHEVWVATNGIEALERFKSVAPDLVVVDNLLPKLDGLRVVAKIRETEPGRVIPIVVASAVYRRGEDLDELRKQYGFSDLLEKPFTQADVESMLGPYLGEERDERSAEHDALALEEPLPADATEQELGGRNVAEIIVDLFRQRASGVLTVRNGDVTKVVFIDSGSITHARSNSRLDRLGRVLLRQGRITLEQYEHAKRLQVNSAGTLKLGEALAELGYLGAQEVDGAVRLQVTNIVLSLFEWREGHFSFHGTSQLPADYVRLSLNTPDLVFWGLRRLEGREDFRTRLPAPRMILSKVPAGERVREQLTLTSFEEQVLGMTEGQPRLGEVLSIGRLGHVDVARVIYSFLALGVLAVRPEGEAEAPAADIGVPEVLRRGDLGETTIASVVARIWLAGASGRLHLLCDKEWRELHFDRGRVVWTASNRTSHKLGEVLLAVGKLRREDLDKALELKRSSPERRLGSILLELRALTLEELNWGLRFQAQRIVLELLTWTEGVFSFEPREPADDQMLTLSTSTQDLILEGTRRNPAPQAVHDLIRSRDTSIAKAWDPLRVARHLKLGPNEMRLLDSVETCRTGRELMALGIMDEEELARSLHGLLSLEVVKIASPQEVRGRAFSTSGEGADPLGIDTPPEGTPAFLDADEDSGVVPLGTVTVAPEDAPRLAIECEALRAENARLRARIRKLESLIEQPSVLPDLPVGPLEPPGPLDLVEEPKPAARGGT